jgi:hypothetical protein
MPPESVRLRAQLSEHLGDLNHLEVIEAAEGIVRRRLLELLRTELAGLRDDLAEARRHLSTARDGGDLGFVIEAEERVSVLLRQTTIMQRQTGEHIRASNRAHGAYMEQYGRLVSRIDEIRRLLD